MRGVSTESGQKPLRRRGSVRCTAAAAQKGAVRQGDKWFPVHAGAHADEEWFVSERSDLAYVPAIGAAGREALEQADIGIDQVSVVDLHCCSHWRCRPRRRSRRRHLRSGAAEHLLHPRYHRARPVSARCSRGWDAGAPARPAHCASRLPRVGDDRGLRLAGCPDHRRADRRRHAGADTHHRSGCTSTSITEPTPPSAASHQSPG